MSTIPGNSLVTVIVGDAESAFAQSPTDVLNAVSAYLNALNGQYSVETTSFSGGVMSTISPIISEEFQATIMLQNNYSEDSSQLTSDVQGAFTVASSGSYTPNNITIPSYTPLAGSASGIGVPVSTGQAVATPTLSQSVALSGTSLTSQISSFFTSLTSLGTNLLIGLAAIIVLVLVLAAYGPNVGKIASAVA